METKAVSLPVVVGWVVLFPLFCWEEKYRKNCNLTKRIFKFWILILTCFIFSFKIQKLVPRDVFQINSGKRPLILGSHFTFCALFLGYGSSKRVFLGICFADWVSIGHREDWDYIWFICQCSFKSSFNLILLNTSQIFKIYWNKIKWWTVWKVWSWFVSGTSEHHSTRRFGSEGKVKADKGSHR